MVFIVANVTRAIIGADFLHHFGLYVDIRHRTLANSTTLLYVCGLSSSTLLALADSHIFGRTQITPLTLLSEFPAVTQACVPDRLASEA